MLQYHNHVQFYNSESILKVSVNPNKKNYISTHESLKYKICYLKYIVHFRRVIGAKYERKTQKITYLALSVTQHFRGGHDPGPPSILAFFATSGKALGVLHIFLPLLTYCRREISLITLNSTWQLC